MADPQHFPRSLFTTLIEAREWLNSAVKLADGAICPCCDRFDKVYDRSVPQSAVRVIAQLHRYTARHGTGFHHYTQFKQSKVGWEFAAHFRLLGLVERATNTQENKKTSGMYRITEKGSAFVRGELAIPHRIFLYHDELVGVSPETKYIHDFWPGFNYSELMAA